MDINLIFLGQMVLFVILVWFIIKFIWLQFNVVIEECQKKVVEGLVVVECVCVELKDVDVKVVVEIKQVCQQVVEIVECVQQQVNQIVDKVCVEVLVEVVCVKVVVMEEVVSM